MDHPNTLTTNLLFQQIDRLGKDGNLAAVIIHLNDTYVIEERRFGERLALPGMPRIASLIRTIRDATYASCGTDRTLVVHSGDFLSPSLLGKRFKGKAMIDVLNELPLQYTTLGNHEFDFGKDTLAQRLCEAKFEVVLANLKPPVGCFSDFPFREVIFWPESAPLIAITGLVSEEVARSAVALGFTYEPYGSALLRVRDLAAQSTACKLIILSHCSQSDDRDLANRVIRIAYDRFPRPLVLGGHDHDIHWGERPISKNLSNCRSVSVFLVPIDSLAWGYQENLRALNSMTDDGIELIKRVLQDEDPLELEARYPDSVRCLAHLPPLVANAFSKRLDWAACRLRQSEAERNALSLAEIFFYAESSDEDYYQENGFTGRYPLYTSESDLNYAPDPSLQVVVDSWLAKPIVAQEPIGDAVIRHFSAFTESFDVRDDNLRSGSTDFGNLVVDCIKQSMQADVALVNAGSFRADMDVSAAISPRSLEGIFLFDAPEAIMLITVSGTALGAILQQSDSSAGHGRVLQRTENIDNFVSPGITVRLAIVSFLVCDASNSDGYVGVLADIRGVEQKVLLNEMNEAKRETGRRIIESITQSIYDVPYRAASRFSLKARTAEEQDISEVVELIRSYRKACGDAGLDRGLWAAVLNPSGNTPAQWAPDPLPQIIGESRARLYDWIDQKIKQTNIKYLYRLEENLSDHPDVYIFGHPHRAYLYAAVEARRSYRIGL